MTTLTCGIRLKDNRNLGLGISIENQNTKYLVLRYSGAYFYIKTTGTNITADKLPEYLREVELMRSALIEANQIFFP